MMRRSLERKEVVREMVFTDEELQSLNAHIEDVPYADMILFACLIGLRPKESNRQIIIRSTVKLPQPFASWSNLL